MSYHPLPDCLQVAVPFKILELKRRGGPTDEEFELARSIGDLIAEKGDVLLYREYRSPKKGTTAQLFNALVQAIAVGAFLPGGVKIYECHYEVPQTIDPACGSGAIAEVPLCS